MTDRLDRIEAMLERSAVQHDREIRELRQNQEQSAALHDREIQELRQIQTAGKTAHDLEILEIRQLQADNANAIKVLTEHQAQYAEQLRAEVTNLTELSQVVTQQHGETIARIDIMQSEVRGLQVENRRIMERWDNGNQN